MAQQYSTSTHWVAAMHLNNTGNSRTSPQKTLVDHDFPPMKLVTF